MVASNGRAAARQKGVQFVNVSSLSTFVAYAGAVALCLLVLVCVLNLWHAEELRVPFNYRSDALLHNAVIKGVIDNGWSWRNDYIGMPAGFDARDFPVADNLHLLIIHFLSLFSTDSTLILNLLFLLTFPLATISSLYVLRRVGISYPVALFGSLLYTFLPYHFLRGEAHLFLSDYVIVPPIILVILRVCSGTLLKSERGAEEITPAASTSIRRITFSVIVCLLISAAGIYYPFFACYLLLVAGLVATLRAKELRHLLIAALLTTIIFAGVALNYAPSFLYTRANKATPISQRGPAEAETFGLKIVQLLMPIYGHRIKALTELVNQYLVNRPLVNENDTASLGMIGSSGFLLLLVWLLRPRRETSEAESIKTHQLLDHLSALNIAAVLLGTIGGFGAVFALLISAQVRSYNRISIFIAFFALCAVCLVLENISRTLAPPGLRRIAFYIFLGLALIIGILDQTSARFIPDYAALKSAYENDRDFVNRIEASMPPGAPIFQLPYAQFPEPPKVNQLDDYDHLRAYLHSKRLRFSYGAMMTRESDVWQKTVAAQSPNQLVATLAQAGFKGIYLDRKGYADHGLAIEDELTKLLGAHAFSSRDGRFLFFNIAAYNRKEK
jgi:phosphoglycerol transferase